MKGINQFFTEFPVDSNFSSGSLGEYICNWISGIEASQVNIKKLRELIRNGEEFSFEDPGGERLTFSTVSVDDGPQFGYQYDLPDNHGRTWRTEAIIARRESKLIFSLKVLCIKGDFSAQVATPRRPVLLKQILEHAIGGFDGKLTVSDSPHFISDNEVDKARDAILGRLNSFLPVVYVSSLSSNELPLNAEKLAFELGGLAHVFVEPDRSFSFVMKDETEDRNPYGGAVGIALPGKPIQVRVLPIEGPDALLQRVVSLVKETFVGRTSRHNAEWTDLVQAAYKNAREKIIQNSGEYSGSAELDLWIENFEGELREKDQTISDLRSENARLTSRLAGISAESNISQILTQLRGEVGELYEGELLDRLRNAIASSSNAGFAVSDRDRAVMDALLKFLDVSAYSARLIDALKSGSDNDRTDSVFSEVLSALGFSRSEQGSHIKYQAPEGLTGIENIIIAKTPSDYKAGENSVSNAKKALGLRFASSSKS